MEKWIEGEMAQTHAKVGHRAGQTAEGRVHSVSQKRQAWWLSLPHTESRVEVAGAETILQSPQ